MSDYAKISQVGNEYLGQSEPASTFVEASQLTKAGCRVEIEAIAVKEEGF